MKAHEILANPDNWCKGRSVQLKINPDEKYVPPPGPTTNLKDLEEYRFCIYGAMAQAYPIDHPKKEEAYNKLRAALKEPISIFNDKATHQEVYHLLLGLDL